MRRFVISLSFLIALLAAFGIASAQNFGAAPQQFVTVLPLDPIHIPAGRPATVDLHLRVAANMHINAHAPHQDYLIPTTLTAAAAPGIMWGAIDYPTGVDRTFIFSPTEKFSVYAEDVTLRVHLIAQPGDHTATATLRYQACDNRACYPPRNIPVKFIVTAK